MPPSHTPEELIAQCFVFEIARLPDTPLGPFDEILYEHEPTGRLLIARAPILSDPA